MAVKTRKRKSLKHIKKLSTLLAMGLRDLRKQERGKNCRVNMLEWWAPKEGQRTACVACLAGSVMKYGLMRPRSTRWHAYVTPEDYDDSTRSRLHALNWLRTGYTDSAADYLNVHTTVPYRDVPEYSDDRDGWWAAMRRLLADLKAAGE